MKKIIAGLIVVFFIVGLGGCARKSIEVTKIPIRFEDTEEGNVFHNVDIEWMIHYDGRKIREIEMRMISGDSEYADFDTISYRRSIDGEKRHLTAESASTDYFMYSEISSFSVLGDEVTFTVNGGVIYEGEQEALNDRIEGTINIERAEIDEQGNASLWIIDGDYELPIQNAEMKYYYPEWSYREMKAVSSVASVMMAEFLVLFFI